VALLALLAAQWPGGLPVLLEAIVPGRGPDLSRVTLWHNSLILAQDYAIIGAGLAGYMMLYSTYSMLIHVGFSYHSHNLYLDMAIEQGLPALLLFGAMCLIFWWRLESQLRPYGPQRPHNGRPAPAARRPLPAVHRSSFIVRRPPSAGRRLSSAFHPPALGAAALSLVIILVHGLVDDALYGSRGLFFLFAPFAFVASRTSPTRILTYSPRPRVATRKLANSPRPQVATRPFSLLTAYFSLTLLLTLFLAWYPPTRALYYANLGAVYQSRAELSVYEWPAWDLQDRVRREVDLSAAVAAYERALALSPGNATANRRLGQIALSRGDYEAALLHLERAYAATPWDSATRQLLGEAYATHGRVADAARLWAAVNNHQRQLEIRAYWYGAIHDQQRAAWVREAIALAGRQ
jgi:hypothetical protein